LSGAELLDLGLEGGPAVRVLACLLEASGVRDEKDVDVVAEMNLAVLPVELQGLEGWRNGEEYFAPCIFLSRGVVEGGQARDLRVCKQVVVVPFLLRGFQVSGKDGKGEEGGGLLRGGKGPANATIQLGGSGIRAHVAGTAPLPGESVVMSTEAGIREVRGPVVRDVGAVIKRACEKLVLDAEEVGETADKRRGGGEEGVCCCGGGGNEARKGVGKLLPGGTKRGRIGSAQLG